MSLQDIELELERLPISINKYRPSSGDGRSQAFGIVNRRCLPPDYSRQCWLRPYLYHLLLEYGRNHVPFAFTSVTVNQNYKADPHKDKGNVGQSYLVGFGDYTGGDLEIHEGPLKGLHDVRTPIIADFTKILHSVKDFQGTRYSLVYYTCKKSEGLPGASVEFQDSKWVFLRGGVVCKSLPHPLAGRKRVNQTQQISQEPE
jgi:hypothetical protein